MSVRSALADERKQAIKVKPIGKSVLVTGARAPAALHLARNLNAAGHTVLLLDHLNDPLAKASRSHHGYHRIPSFRLDPDEARSRLLELIDRHRIELVVPTCEEIFYLAQIWRDDPPNATLFSPDVDQLEQVHNKHRFILLCQSLGLTAPTTQLLQSRADLAACADAAETLVFKPVWSRFATQVLMRPSQNRLSQISPTTTQPWVAQEFLRGDEICAYAVAHSGKLTALSAYVGVIRAGRGAAVCFEPVQDEGVRRFVEAFVAGTNWTGQVSFDLIRDSNGRVFPMECNPRATSGIHFFSNKSDFADALMSPTGHAMPDITSLQGVRLALWLYGPSTLLSKNGLRGFWHAVGNTQDVLNQPDDPVGLGAQARSVFEFLRIAFSHRISLQKASTFDLEWDGPDQSSSS